MSGHGGGGGGLGSILGWFIVIILAMFAIWYYTGGPERNDLNQPFQKPLAPLDTGETYGPGTTGTTQSQ